MTDRPILFSAPMIRALLDGRKTQTRRALKEQRHVATAKFISGRWQWHGWKTGCLLGDVALSFAPGDRLWVKEAWRARVAADDLPPRDLIPFNRPLWFEAERDGSEYSKRTDFGRYRHARFMPRWASRLTLTVTDVRVQRLQEISEADAVAEGVGNARTHDLDCGPTSGVESVFDGTFCADHRDAMLHAWQTLHGPGAWAANPWVCALTFTVHRCNIDQMLGSAG